MKISEYDARVDKLRFRGLAVLQALVQAHKLTLLNKYYKAAESIEAAIYRMREDDIEGFAELLNDVLHQEPDES